MWRAAVPVRVLHYGRFLMPSLHFHGQEFRVERELIEVSSMSRPDEHWFFTDPAGHIHQWWERKPFRPMSRYSPEKSYFVPSITWVEDSPATDDYPAIGHHECSKCRARVHPGTRADDCMQYLPGMTRCYIDDREVTKDVFEAEYKKARGL